MTAAHFNSTRLAPSVKANQLPLLPHTPKSGYGFLCTVLDELEALPSVRAFLDGIKRSRRNTRPGYPPTAMFRAVCLKYLLAERFTVGFIERLRTSPRLAELCGFSGSLPSEATFSRFFKLLSTTSGDDFMADMVEKLRVELPDLGDSIAVDSTDIEAYSNPNRSVVSDPDAEWGRRTTKSQSTKTDTEPFFGYKSHALCDTVYGAPIAHIVLPANANDSPQLPKMVQKAQQTHSWLKPKHLLADRGYDALSNHTFLVKRRIIPIIHIRKPSNSKLYDGIYNKDGLPVCDDKTPMVYLGTDPKTGYHLFRCSPTGCSLKAKSNGAMRYCDISRMAEDPMNNLRVLGIVARASPQWKALYKRRPIIERMFGSMKRMRLLDKHQYRSRRKIEMHIALSSLTYLATMLGHVRAGDMARIRHMRIPVG